MLTYIALLLSILNLLLLWKHINNFYPRVWITRDKYTKHGISIWFFKNAHEGCGYSL